MVAILVLLTVISFLTVDYLVQRAQARRAVLIAQPQVSVRIPAPAIPRGLFFDRTHQWLDPELDGFIRVGVDQIPSAILGRSFSVELPKENARVKKGDTVVTFRKGERTLSIPAPVDGEIKTVNHDLKVSPDRIKSEPYGLGWLYEIRPERMDSSVLASRLVGEDAATWMKSEFNRLRDFVASAAAKPAYAGATLQDGGEPVEGFGENLTTEQWEELKQKFFA